MGIAEDVARFCKHIQKTKNKIYTQMYTDGKKTKKKVQRVTIKNVPCRGHPQTSRVVVAVVTAAVEVVGGWRAAVIDEARGEVTGGRNVAYQELFELR